MLTKKAPILKVYLADLNLSHNSFKIRIKNLFLKLTNTSNYVYKLMNHCVLPPIILDQYTLLLYTLYAAVSLFENKIG